MSNDTATTVADAAAAFLASRDLQPRSRTVYGYTLSRLVTHVGADKAVHALQPRTLNAFMNRYYAQAAPNTWNLNIAALRSFFAYCRRQGWTTKDPTAAIERRQLRTNPDSQVIPAEQIERLWHRTDIGLREETLWRLLYDTGARATEILALVVAVPDRWHSPCASSSPSRVTPAAWAAQQRCLPASLQARLLASPFRGDLPPPPVDGPE